VLERRGRLVALTIRHLVLGLAVGRGQQPRTFVRCEAQRVSEQPHRLHLRVGIVGGPNLRMVRVDTPERFARSSCVIAACRRSCRSSTLNWLATPVPLGPRPSPEIAP
jgi:hypothetical protein